MAHLNSDSAIRDLTERLLQQQLPKDEWTHEAHLAAAICLHVEYPNFDLKTNMKAVICAHNESVGTPNSDTDGYHHTITLFYAYLVEVVCLKNSATSSLSEILGTVMNSPMGDRKYTLKFYSSEVLFSVLARKQWVEPDVKSLDFISEDIEKSILAMSVDRSEMK